MRMQIISTRDDIITWLKNNKPDIASGFGDEGVENVADAILDDDHPDFGADWEEWLAGDDLRDLIEDVLDELDDEDEDPDDDEEEDIDDEEDDEDLEDED